MNTLQHEIDTIESKLDILRMARFKRFHAAMFGTVLSVGTLASASAEWSVMALCFYFSMAAATVSSQISMSDLKERRDLLQSIILSEKQKLRQKTNAQ